MMRTCKSIFSCITLLLAMWAHSIYAGRTVKLASGPDEKTIKLSMNKSTGEIALNWADLQGRSHEWLIHADTLQGLFQCPKDLPPDCSLRGDYSPWCYGKCISFGVALISYNKPSEDIYFIVPLDTATNVPWAFFKANPRRRTLQYLFTDFGSGVQDASLSPTGNWISYIRGSHGGVCSNERLPRIYDLVRHTFIKVSMQRSAKDSVIWAESAAWVSDREVEFEIFEYGCPPNSFKVKKMLTIDVTASSDKQ
jgi:hypothetical protein